MEVEIGTKLKARSLYTTTDKTVVGFDNCKITGRWIIIKDDKRGNEEAIKEIQAHNATGSGYFFAN